jgi:hypothetical protein
MSGNGPAQPVSGGRRQVSAQATTGAAARQNPGGEKSGTPSRLAQAGPGGDAYRVGRGEADAEVPGDRVPWRIAGPKPEAPLNVCTDTGQRDGRHRHRVQTSDSSLIRPTRSHCRPIRCSWIRSSTWSGSTTTRRRRLWCCASMRRSDRPVRSGTTPSVTGNTSRRVGEVEAHNRARLPQFTARERAR